MRILSAAALTAVLLYPCAQAATCEHEPVAGRPTIGLVLGGGGARGGAHIGVLKVLKELRVPVDYVGGTSMGALIGGFYATGMTTEELEQTVLGLDWDELFTDETQREDQPFRRKRDDDLALFGPKLGVGPDSSLLPRGYIGGQKISFLFETLASSRINTTDFDALPIPYRAVAADILTGDVVVFSEGNLALAMRASMSLPGVFDPVEFEDRLLVDGGIVNNVPVDVVRAMGAQTLIVVDVGSPLAAREKVKNLVSITSQLTTIMIHKNVAQQLLDLRADDILIRPALGRDVTTGDFGKSDVAIARGYEAADGMRDVLARLSVSEEAYAAHRGHVESCVAAPQTIEFVRLDNQSRYDDSVIMERLHVATGQPLDIARLDDDIKQIYALGFLEQARYEVVEENDRAGVVVHVQQDSRGTKFVESGLDLFGTEDDNGINLRFAYLKTDVDRLGSELRLLAQFGQDTGFLAELYKPLDTPLRFIALPKVFLENKQFQKFDSDGNVLAQFEDHQMGGSLAIGREIGRSAAVFGGVRRFSGDIDVQVGDPSIADDDYDGGEYLISLFYDRLNDRYFPSTGSLASLEYIVSDESLGADAEFEQISASFLKAWTHSPHTLMAGFRYNTTLDDDAPSYALFRGGGFTRLSGLAPNQIFGQHFGLAFAGYRYALGRAEGRWPASVGTTLEFGNAADDRADVLGEGIVNGSLYLAFRSPVGPLYIGVGLAEGGYDAYFLRVGNVFGNSSIGR